VGGLERAAGAFWARCARGGAGKGHRAQGARLGERLGRGAVLGDATQAGLLGSWRRGRVAGFLGACRGAVVGGCLVPGGSRLCVGREQERGKEREG
jgi:hypothetical protein